ncbi:DNA-primase RepB domain-containing protein [Candidatus Nitrotoga sp. 1052]|uniref:DNA-primase RepB domain-containing protein n=1 Tax=Candidatus Nitrotoga sp. 1052 TaxID=2886964 RepID=UPI001EF68B53|nr:DNA-primase RepB domain-containing protein [Candidatus Nitrotoga sp. 1052]CAH1083763.1 hypothetical protein NTG1052_490004 [Candidatus Nitrotoga sp. 1052]
MHLKNQVAVYIPAATATIPSAVSSASLPNQLSHIDDARPTAFPIIASAIDTQCPSTIPAIDDLASCTYAQTQSETPVDFSPSSSESPTVSSAAQLKGGKGGEGGVTAISNAEFFAAVFPQLTKGAFALVCSKPGDPNEGGWPANRADLTIGRLSTINNNYINCSSFYPGNDGSFKAQKSQFAACHFLMLDDLGTKVMQDRLGEFKLSALIETSPGNHQGIIILAEPITDGDVATRLLNALIDAGLCDGGASGPLTRWARLPVAINGKPKHADHSGMPFRCRLVEWNLNARYTPEEIVDGLQLVLPPAGRPPKASKVIAENARSSKGDDHGDEVWLPKAAVNPVLVALKSKGLYKTPPGFRQA